MAEPKKTSKKTNRSFESSTTAKSGGELIEEVAAENPTDNQSARPLKDPAKSENQLLSGQEPRWFTMLTSQSFVMVMAGTAFVVALLALAVSIMSYRQTADETVPGQTVASAVFTGADQADTDKLSSQLDSLAALIAQNSHHFAILEQDLASAKATWSTDSPSSTDLADLMARVLTLEAKGALGLEAPSVKHESAPRGGFDTAQIGLIVAVGLLAENLAGRDIKNWAVLIDDLEWLGIDAADRDIIRGAARTPVDSRADLLSMGRLQLGPMVQALHKADNGSGLLEQALASVANLIQLRRTGGNSDQPETVIESFESALDNANFDAAFAAASIWSSTGLDGLESWLPAAQRRHDLDQAVNRLVAIFLQQAVGQN